MTDATTDRRGREEGGWPAVALAVAARPVLWPTALVVAARLVPRRWWRRRPRRPAPDPAYVRFRTLTATGSATGAPDPADVVDWLEWCRAWRRLGLG